jgi:hypothetical protein
MPTILDGKKQILVSTGHSNPAFVGAFSTDAEVEALKAAPGSMAYSSQQTHGRLYVYDGSNWKYVTFDG